MTESPNKTDAGVAEQAQAEKKTAEHQGNDTPSASDIADELRYAPLANLRGRSERAGAKALVHRLAEDYPRGAGKRGAKPYRQVKTLAAFELTIAAFLAELLAAHSDKRRGGWIRCSLKKKDFSGEAVTHANFTNVRDAWVAAGLVDEVKGYPGWFEFGNPGPARGRMTRYRAALKLLATCAEYGITPDNVSEHFWIEFEMPTELVQLTSPARPTPTNFITTRLREEVAELNEFIGQQTITPSSIRHIGWVRKFHRADHPDFKWNKGGRLYSQPPVGMSNYQNRAEDERIEMTINGEDLVEDFEKKLARKDITSQKFDHKAYPMKVVREKVLKRHPLLENWGGKIRGRVRDWSDLMFTESDAIIRTMLTLKRQHGVPSLPVYDAIIVPMSKVQVARETLIEQFRKVTGVEPGLDVNALGKKAWLAQRRAKDGLGHP
jgi:hypothetical protein